MSSYIRASSLSPSDESSDLDLDLEELDPTNGGGGIGSGGGAGYSVGYRSVLGENHRSSFSPTRRGRTSIDGAGGPGRIPLRRMKGREGPEDEEALLGRRSGEQDTHHEGEISNLRDGGVTRGGEGLLRRLGSRISLRSTAGEDAVVDFTPSKETRAVGLRPGGAGGKYPPNIISNHKFTAFTFLPLTLWHEFSFFFNLYFLLVALSQCIPALRIGYLSSYIVPLVFVLSITLGKEAHDDIARRRRDTEANSELYEVLSFTDGGVLRRKKRARLGKKKKSATGAEGQGLREGGDDGDDIRIVPKKSKDLKVGDILVLKKDDRVPADVVILKTISNEVNQAEEGGGDDTSGEAFIRTDQLDGETDWKLRLAPALTQALQSSSLAHLTITASAPSKEVNSFIGSISLDPPAPCPTASSAPGSSMPLGPGAPSSSLSALPATASSSMGLSVDNTAWANTVLASNSTTLAAIVYTGPETRAALSTSRSRSKTGLLEKEINNLTKILCVLTFSLSIALVALQGFENNQDKLGAIDPENPGEVVNRSWYIKILRFLVLFSTIIPISLRVNLDMGKSAYAWFIEHDKGIKGTVVRTSTIPEELGRVEYLLSDKTGTLTQNDMELKKIHVGTVSYAGEAMDEVTDYIRLGFPAGGGTGASGGTQATPGIQLNAATTRTRREIGSRVRDVVLALALCHNVTPTTATDEGASEATVTYQASSPDEIAIVRWTESVGLRLSHRDRKGMKLQSVDTGKVVVRVKVLEVFPFTSEGKRMGIVVQFMAGEKGKESDLLGGGAEEENSNAGDIWFYQKGADTVMSSIVQANDWLDEECGNMAREGLRTLVIGRKKLSIQRYQEFSAKHKAASLLLVNRDKEMGRVVEEYLEHDLELLGVTGVEDKLQKDVKPSLELLRNAGIKIWMLTGDKVETARCVAVSAKLVSRGQYVHTIAKCMPTSLFSCLRAILTRVRLCSKTKRPCLRCPRIPPQQDRLLSPHRR